MRNLLFCLILLTSVATAQNSQDSLVNQIKTINHIYPGIRPYSIQFEHVGNRNYSSNLLGKDFEDGEIVENFRVKSSAFFPILLKTKIKLTGTLGYVYQRITTAEVVSRAEEWKAYNKPQTVDRNDVTFSLSAVLKDSLFNRTIIYSSSVILNSRSAKEVEKFKAMFAASLILKATQKTVITTGVVGFVDPSAIIPFFPTFSVWHKFNSNWQLDFILPSRLYLRHPVLANGWLSFGTEMNGTHGFSTPGLPVLSGSYEHSNLLLQSGVNFEYPLLPNVLFGVRGGIEHALTSRMVKVNDKTSNYVSSTATDPAPFATLSISFVPVFKSKK